MGFPPHVTAKAPASPFVSVVIPHYNDLSGLVECLRLLELQSYPRENFEIVVADNNSRCGLEAVRAAAPTARVTPAPEQGAGPARNAGICASRGEVLALIDSDCQPDREWLRRGVEALQLHDFIGGRVIATSRDARPNAIEAFEMVFAFDFKRYIEKVGFTGTGNMFVPRRIFDAVGGFRSGVAEDMEWSFRARDKNYSLGYAPLSVVCHPARREWRDLKTRWARMLDEEFLLACEQPYGPLKWVGRTVLMPVSIAPHAWRVLRSERLTRLVDRLGAIGVLARLRLWRTLYMARLLLGAAQAKTQIFRKTAVRSIK